MSQSTVFGALARRLALVMGRFPTQPNSSAAFSRSRSVTTHHNALYQYSPTINVTKHTTTLSKRSFTAQPPQQPKTTFNKVQKDGSGAKPSQAVPQPPKPQTTNHPPREAPKVEPKPPSTTTTAATQQAIKAATTAAQTTSTASKAAITPPVPPPAQSVANTLNSGLPPKPPTISPALTPPKSKKIPFFVPKVTTIVAMGFTTWVVFLLTDGFDKNTLSKLQEMEPTFLWQQSKKAFNRGVFQLKQLYHKLYNGIDGVQVPARASAADKDSMKIDPPCIEQFGAQAQAPSSPNSSPGAPSARNDDKNEQNGNIGDKLKHIYEAYGHYPAVAYSHTVSLINSIVEKVQDFSQKQAAKQEQSALELKKSPQQDQNEQDPLLKEAQDRRERDRKRHEKLQAEREERERVREEERRLKEQQDELELSKLTHLNSSDLVSSSSSQLDADVVAASTTTTPAVALAPASVLASTAVETAANLEFRGDHKDFNSNVSLDALSQGEMPFVSDAGNDDGVQEQLALLAKEGQRSVDGQTEPEQNDQNGQNNTHLQSESDQARLDRQLNQLSDDRAHHYESESAKLSQAAQAAAHATQRASDEPDNSALPTDIGTESTLTTPTTAPSTVADAVKDISDPSVEDLVQQVLGTEAKGTSDNSVPVHVSDYVVVDADADADVDIIIVDAVDVVDAIEIAEVLDVLLVNDPDQSFPAVVVDVVILPSDTTTTPQDTQDTQELVEAQPSSQSDQEAQQGSQPDIIPISTDHPSAPEANPSQSQTQSQSQIHLEEDFVEEFLPYPELPESHPNLTSTRMLESVADNDEKSKNHFVPDLESHRAHPGGLFESLPKDPEPFEDPLDLVRGDDIYTESKAQIAEKKRLQEEADKAALKQYYAYQNANPDQVVIDGIVIDLEPEPVEWMPPPPQKVELVIPETLEEKAQRINSILVSYEARKEWQAARQVGLDQSNTVLQQAEREMGSLANELNAQLTAYQLSREDLIFNLHHQIVNFDDQSEKTVILLEQSDQDFFSKCRQLIASHTQSALNAAIASSLVANEKQAIEYAHRLEKETTIVAETLKEKFLLENAHQMAQLKADLDSKYNIELFHISVQHSKDVDELQAKYLEVIDKILKKVDTLAVAITAQIHHQEQLEQVQQLTVALIEAERLLARGESLKQPLQTLKKIAKFDPTLDHILSTISSDVVEYGVAPIYHIQRSFYAAEGHAHRYCYLPPTKPFISQVIGAMFYAFTVTSHDLVAVPETTEQDELDYPSSISEDVVNESFFKFLLADQSRLRRAGYFFERGQLSSALQELNVIKNPNVRMQVQPIVAKVRDRLQLDQTLQVLKAHTTALRKDIENAQNADL